MQTLPSNNLSLGATERQNGIFREERAAFLDCSSCSGPDARRLLPSPSQRRVMPRFE